MGGGAGRRGVIFTRRCRRCWIGSLAGVKGEDMKRTQRETINYLEEARNTVPRAFLSLLRELSPRESPQGDRSNERKGLFGC